MIQGTAYRLETPYGATNFVFDDKRVLSPSGSGTAACGGSKGRFPAAAYPVLALGGKWEGEQRSVRQTESPGDTALMACSYTVAERARGLKLRTRGTSGGGSFKDRVQCVPLMMSPPGP